MALLLDYRFTDTSVTHAGGGFPLQFSGATKVSGSIGSVLGALDGAVDLGASGAGRVDVSALQPDLARFCIRVVVQANADVQARQNLVESSRLPFALFLDKGMRPGEMSIWGSVRPSAHGWHAATTRFGPGVKPGVWHTIDLAYDLDTAAIFVDGVIAAVQAFPDGRIAAMQGSDLFLGTWVDGARDHFNGKIAALQVHAGLPEELEAQLDERRSHPEWFISHKRVAVATTVDLGEPSAAVGFDGEAGAYVQPHERGLIMYHDSLGAAFEMHGEIHRFYVGQRIRSHFGYLTSDEGDASPRRGGRKNTFSKAAIYWSPATGAVPVLDRIFLSYEEIDGVELIGFPVRSPSAVPGGLEQEFQGGRMYHRAGSPTAHEVHGAILAKYLQIGGPARWGFPVSHEMDVRRDGQPIGKVSEFEGCSIYWSPATGALEVHGDILVRYRSLRGPAGELGFPTSDELDIPGVPGARFNTFASGALCWFGDAANLIHVRPFTIFLDRIETRESEGFGMGQNDIYLREVKLEQNGRVLYNQRHPRDGDWGGANNRELDIAIPAVIVPNSPDDAVTFTVDVWDGDPGADDHLGRYTKVLDPANAWGLRENQGVINSGSFSKVKALLWSVKPQVDPAALTDVQKFWGRQNASTALIPYDRYAAAFRDVDSETEWWDVADWLDKAFYELVVDTLASTGNCFGMSLEAIYARKGVSLFGLPLDRFTDWAQLEPEFNIKHCYQVGASPIWWFVGQFLSGNTHDPKDVFTRTHEAFLRGRHPVICVAQNYDFSGKPHCILPVAWDFGVRPWKMTISDPNAPQALRELFVDPDRNTFRYVGSDTYEGGEWSGGRLHYMPFDVLDSRPRTPVWDAILLLLAGTVLILGSDARTEAITDLDGNDLDAHGERAKERLRGRGGADEFFVGFKGFDALGRGTVAADMLLQMRQPGAGVVRPRVELEPELTAQLRLGDLLGDRALRALSVELSGQAGARQLMAERSIRHLLADPVAMRGLSAEAQGILRNAASLRKRGDYIHRIVGGRGGTLRYAAKRGLSQMLLTGPIADAERHEVSMRDMATSKWSVAVRGGRDKRLGLTFESRLGTGRDRVRMSLDGVPMTASRGLEMNLRPGLGGLDLMTDGGRVELPVTLETRIDGQARQRRFTVPAEGGVRVQLSNLVSDGMLKASSIGQLFGPASGGVVLRPT